jgi:hypothetical protein
VAGAQSLTIPGITNGVDLRSTRKEPDITVAHLILYASVIIVAALAMRPKLSLALLSTLPVALAIAESRVPDGIPDWLLISGIIATAYCLAAVIVAFLFRRSGDVAGPDGSLPLGREAHYSTADKAGLWYTFVVLCVAITGCIVAVVDPPYESSAVRIIAALLVPAFGALARGFWLLIRDRDIRILIREDGLEIVQGVASALLVPWTEIGGHTFWFGIFRVYDKAGRRILRVDNTIDGFVTLLYHVNRKTFRNA